MAEIKEEIREELVNGKKHKYKWYSTQVYVGRDENGKRKYKRISSRDKNEVLRGIGTARQEQKDIEGRTVTLGEALEEYIVSRTAVCSPSTIRGYEIIRRNAMPKLMVMPISEINQKVIQAAFNEYAKDHSPKTCRNVHNLLSAVLSQDRPEIKLRTTLPQKEHYDIYVPDEAEISAIYAVVRGGEMEVPFLLAAECGLRASEIAALKYANVFADHVRVCEAIVRNQDNEFVTKSPKSYAGYRDVPITEQLYNIIVANNNDSGKVTDMNSAEIGNKWCTIRTKNPELIDENLNFHALRHHFASKCLLMGIPQKYIAELMGHNSTNMIERVYQHVFPSAMEGYADLIRDKQKSLISTSNATQNATQ